MERDNRIFKEIISGEFDEGISSSLELFDSCTDDFYNNLDRLIGEVRETGVFTTNVSLNQVAASFELVLTEILEQDADQDSNINDIIGLAIADALRRIRYIENALQTEPAKQKSVEEIHKSFYEIINELQADGADIAQEFTAGYMIFTQMHIQKAIDELSARNFKDRRDNQ
ncbi:MAG: hypothetical protein L0H36_03065 [bacterium]|nr:hypothetical protein [bacterium]